MGFTLDKVVPWGRSYEEYVALFGLTESDLRLRLLGCGDGPAGFNAELTRRGGRVTSIDPIYAFGTEEIRSRIAETYHPVMEQMHANQGDYVWTTIASVENLGEVRMGAMKTFLADFDAGKRQHRYVAAALPTLPFKDRKFDIALSSHFLFLYSAQLSAEFHVRALAEMLRVAREARVFPLLELDGGRSPHLPVVTEHFAEQGISVEVRQVAYEFQRGGNEMLVLSPA